MPDLEPLFELKENLYKETCPVILLGGALSSDPETGEMHVQMRLQNIDSRPITAIVVDIHVFDVQNKEIQVLRDRRYLVPVVSRDGAFDAGDLVPAGSRANNFSVAIKRVEFEGEDIWSGSASLLFETLPVQRTLEEAIPEASLSAQFVRDFAATMAENGSGKAMYAPTAYKDLWFCACGEINRMKEEKCYRCAASYAQQQALVTDTETLKAHLEAFEKAEAEKAEQARLAAERKAAEEKAAAEEAARKAAEEKAAAEERARRKKRNFKIFLSISIPAVILAAIFAVILVTYILPQQKYDAAAALLQDGKYDEAVTAFAALENYSNSPERILEAKYNKAEDMLESEKYEDAIAGFEALGDYKDSADRISEAKYRKAMKVMASGAYEEALGQFEAISTYGEAKTQIEACHYELGMSALEQDDFDTAKAQYAFVSGDHALQMQTAFCDKGIALYSAGELTAAAPYLELVTDASLLPKVDAAYYARAVSLQKSGEFDGALELFTAMGDYEDAAVQIQKTHYLKAKSLYSAGSYKDAITEFQTAGDYEDAASRITETTYQYGAQLLNSGQVLDAYNVLYPIRSYQDAYMLLIRNSQFYIHVYDPGVGPNPLDED